MTLALELELDMLLAVVDPEDDLALFFILPAGIECIVLLERAEQMESLLLRDTASTEEEREQQSSSCLSGTSFEDGFLLELGILPTYPNLGRRRGFIWLSPDGL